MSSKVIAIVLFLLVVLVATFPLGVTGMPLFAMAKAYAPGQGCAISLSVSAVPSEGTAPLTVAFYTTVTGTTEPTQWDWWFGDGSHITGHPAETHTYQSPWTYNVVVRVLDWHGCWTQSSLTVNVKSGLADVIPTLVGGSVVIIVAAIGFFVVKKSRRQGSIGETVDY